MSMNKRTWMHMVMASLFLCACGSPAVAKDAFAASDLRCEDLVDPIGIDVAKHLKGGKNTIAFWLGNGWNQRGAGVQTTPTVRAQLEMTDAAGETKTFITDENWRAKRSFMSYTGGWANMRYGGGACQAPAKGEGNAVLRIASGRYAIVSQTRR